MPTNTYDDIIYRVLSVQIPMFWDAIKFACIKADEVPTEYMSDYFNELLQDLLSDKAQCFALLDEKKILHSIAITKIILNKMLNRKELVIQCFYSMYPIKDMELHRNLKVLYDLAVKEECKAITFTSRNSRVWQMAEISGCSEQFRSFIYEMGGK